MKKLRLCFWVTTLLIISVAPALAWDFTMAGQFEWRYRYFGRANGYQDLFGDMRFQDSSLNTTGSVIGFAGPNFYRGYNGGTVAAPVAMPTGSNGSNLMIVRGGFSLADSDAFANDQRMSFEPEIKVNNALRLVAKMDLAGTRAKYNHRDFQTNGPLDRWYQDRVSQNAFDTAMIPSINQYYLVAQLPWGVVQMGARHCLFGISSAQGYNFRNDSLQFIIPYGPFRFAPQIWIAREPPDGYGSFIPYGGTTGPYPGTVPDYDSGQHPKIFWCTVVLYDRGPFSFWLGRAEWMRHTSAADLSGAGFSGVRVTYPNGPFNAPMKYQFGSQDFDMIYYFACVKFNNGRFFANVEGYWQAMDTHYLGVGTPSTGFISGAPPLYNEQSEIVAEYGALCGPAKIGGLFAWSGGPALNNGNPTKVYNGIAIDHIATDNYNYLLFHTYGGGNDAPWRAGKPFTQDDNGAMADAYALAARMDYAVAANLNVWGSYLWASRVEENGWLAGQKSSSGTPSVGTGVSGAWTVPDAQKWKNTAVPGAGAQSSMNPYVDNSFLGWEAGVGVNWKLLEGMTFASRYAYWQPGPWFDQAYQVVGQLPSGAATANGFMQGRSAIQAFEGSILIDF